MTAPKHPIPVGIETDRGLWVAALRDTGRGDLPDQPAGGLAVSGTLCGGGRQIRCHRRSVVGQHCVRTDASAHRPLPADTELAQAIRVLARAQQDAVWARQQIGNQIRDLLKDFYPAALVAFAELPGRRADPASTHAPSWPPHRPQPKRRS